MPDDKSSSIDVTTKAAAIAEAKAAMTPIELVKYAGATRALKDRIDGLVFQLCHNNWDGTARSGKYTRLGEAIADARLLLDSANEALTALQDMEPENV